MDRKKKHHGGGRREHPPHKKRAQENREDVQVVFHRVFEKGSVLDAAYKKAHDILSKRPQITEEHAALLGQHGKSIVAHDRANDAQLTDIYAYEDELLGKKDPGALVKKKENKAISDIFEAMVFDAAKKIFAGTDVEVVLPSQLDDRKQGVDVLLVIPHADGSVRSALALDMATETDMEGYDDGDGGKKGGAEEKIKRSHRNVHAPFNNLMRIKYAEVRGKKTIIEHAPRVLVGSSRETIKALAKKWIEGTLDPTKEPLFQQIVVSMRRQLAALSLSARLKEKNGDGKKSAERTHIHQVHADFKSKIPVVSDVAITDPVIQRILGATKQGARERIRDDAYSEQTAMNSEGFSGDAKKLLTQPLSEEEAKRLADHVQKKAVDPRIAEALTAFMENKRSDFHPTWIPAVAGGIPTRLYRRLRNVASPSAMFGVSPVAHLEEKKEDTHRVHTEHVAEHAREASAATHLAAIAGARTALGASSEAYKTTRGRAWSRVGEWSARFLGAKLGGLVGVGLGTLACMGAWTAVPAFAGAALSQLGLNWWLKKKFKFDERDKLAAIDSLERDAQKMPYTYKQKIKSSGLSEKEWVEKELKRRTKWGKVRRAVIGAVAGGAISLEGGAQLFKGKSLFGELARDWVGGKRSWSDVWGMFCAGEWWKGKAPAPAPAGAGGRGTSALIPQGERNVGNSLFSPNDYDITRRRSLARASCAQHQRWCDIPQWEQGSRPGFRKLAGDQSFIKRFGSGRWNG